MTENRRAQIEQMLQDDPEDQMLQYMLAMELDSAEVHEESLAIYQQLMDQSPPHVDAYFRFAQQKVRLGEIEVARTTLRDGIEIARNQNRMHTASEMGDLLQSLGELGE